MFVTSEDIYLSLDGENVVSNRDKQVVSRYPLHTLSNIISFSYSGASPALMGECAKRGVGMAFCTQRGRFLARVSGENNGNVILRRTQYRTADNVFSSCEIARNMILGKVHNSRWSIERTCRDHKDRVDVDKLKSASSKLKDLLGQIKDEISLESLRGLEGSAASIYFGVYDEMILNNKDHFYYETRSKRPPLDNVNAMLSFAYTLLANDCASALESVGLDAYVGFLHRDRPGRSSLALDLMEELRALVADRFVLTLINNRIVSANMFEKRESGAVLMTDNARRQFLSNWHEKKKGTIKHPYLNEKIQWGMVPYVQALLLARYLREDIDAYPPFLWK